MDPIKPNPGGGGRGIQQNCLTDLKLPVIGSENAVFLKAQKNPSLRPHTPPLAVEFVVYIYANLFGNACGCLETIIFVLSLPALPGERVKMLTKLRENIDDF